MRLPPLVGVAARGGAAEERVLPPQSAAAVEFTRCLNAGDEKTSKYGRVSHARPCNSLADYLPRKFRLASSSVLHKASELPPDVRQVVGRLLGRPLDPEEYISLTAYRPHQAPAGDERAELIQRFQARIDQTAAKLEGVPEAELDALIDEAADHVRHRRP